MTKDLDEEGKKRYHIWLDEVDAQWLRDTFGRSLGYSKAIRLIIKSYRKNIEAKAKAQAKRAGEITDELTADIRRSVGGTSTSDPRANSLRETSELGED